jgi:hypothetical protein
VLLGFAATKCGLAADAARLGITVAAKKMDDSPRKSRATIHCQLAEATGTLGKLDRFTI